MKKIVKIVSGGQTGADRAGLDAAIECGMPHGGWCPKGRFAEDGVIPDKYVLKETSSSIYTERTQKNVADSDMTAVFTFGEPEGGSASTIIFAKRYRKPFRHFDLNRKSDEICREFVKWIEDSGKDGIVLNIAGSRESSFPGIYRKAKKIIHKTLTADI